MGLTNNLTTWLKSDSCNAHFSPEAKLEVRLAYLLMVILVSVYTVIVLIEGLADTCAHPQNRKPDVDDDIYLNPEFSTFGGCLRTRFGFLLFLTPEECMLCRRILLSVVLGMLIGFERRRADRPAGVRTMSLVSLGSCIFTIDSMFAFSSSPDTWDSSRVAAAIPSGVGFLGAGLIYKQSPRHEGGSHEVHGLTTASSVWLSAAVGIAAGGGLCAVAMFSTCTMLIVLRFGPRLQMDDTSYTGSEHDPLGDVLPPTGGGDDHRDADVEMAARPPKSSVAQNLVQPDEAAPLVRAQGASGTKRRLDSSERTTSYSALGASASAGSSASLIRKASLRE